MVILAQDAQNDGAEVLTSKNVILILCEPKSEVASGGGRASTFELVVG